MFKIRPFTLEKEGEVHVVSNGMKIIEGLNEFISIAKFMQARTLYMKAFSEQLKNLHERLSKTKQYFKILLETQRIVLKYQPIMSFGVNLS